MSHVVHVSTGSNTGIIAPYDAGDYHSWKQHEADLLLNNAVKTKLAGTDKAYHVKWTGSPKMQNNQVVTIEKFESEYAGNCAKEDGSVRFSVNRGGGFTINSKRVGHLDRVARPLWEPKDTKTH